MKWYENRFDLSKGFYHKIRINVGLVIIALQFLSKSHILFLGLFRLV